MPTPHISPSKPDSPARQVSATPTLKPGAAPASALPRPVGEFLNAPRVPQQTCQAPPLATLHPSPVTCSPPKDLSGESGPGTQQLATSVFEAVMQTAADRRPIPPVSILPQIIKQTPFQSRPCPATTAPRAATTAPKAMPLPNLKTGSGRAAPVQQAPVPGVLPTPRTTAPGVLPPSTPKGTSTGQPPASRDPRICSGPRICRDPRLIASAPRDSQQAAASLEKGTGNTQVSFVWLEFLPTCPDLVLF
jgi:hypothetical protein